MKILVLCNVKYGDRFYDKISLTHLGHIQYKSAAVHYFWFYPICPQAVAEKKNKYWVILKLGWYICLSLLK